jgi:tetratricopeptide (TPR) repeat protein
VLVAAGLVAYANALSGPFVLDDEDSVVTNEQIRHLWPPSTVLFAARELPTAGRPVVNLSFALNYAVGGTRVRGYHATNIAIHIICAVLLFGVVRRTLGLPTFGGRFDRSASLLALASALIWLAHPLQTDAVNYVTQRTELLMGLFFLLTFYANIRGRDDARWLGLAVVACALGMGSKESMVTAPLLLAIYDRIFLYPSFRDALRRRGGYYLALAASWILLAALIWSGPRSRSAGFSTAVSPWLYLLNQAEIVTHYLRLVVWPRGLVVIYGVPRQLALVDVLPAAAFLALLGALTVWLLVTRPKMGFLGLWFFVTLAPASSVIPIATEVGADRRMYLPLAAIAVALVLAADAWWRRMMPSTERSARLGRRAGVVGLVVLLAALTAATLDRNREYTSTLLLARTTMERWPTPRAEHWLGIELLAANRREEGLATLRDVLPRDESAHYSLGMALYADGQLDDAVAHLRAFLAHEALRLEVPTAHETIGRALKAQRKFAEAADEFREARRMAPSNHTLTVLLADSVLGQERFADAVALYQEYLLSEPGDLGALMNLGIAFAGLGRDADAVAAFRRAVDVGPRDAGANRNLARALLSMRAYGEAETFARRAVQLAPGDAVAHDELGVALAGQRRLDEAIVEFRRSLAIDPTDPETRDHLTGVLRDKDGIMRRP